MDFESQMKALMPERINGKTLKELKEKTAAEDERLGNSFVNGVKFSWMVPPSNLEALKTFEVRDDDVFIFTYPKSGYHWMAEIVNFIQHDGRDDFDRLFMTHVLELTLAFDRSKVDEITPGYKIYEGVKSSRCILSHLPASLWPPQVLGNKAKIVYIARNPKDVIKSLMKGIASNVFENPLTLDEFLWRFFFGEESWGSWFDHVLATWKIRDHPNILFIKYEDLHKDLRGSVCRVAKHIGKDLTDDVINGIVERVSFAGMKKTYQQIEDEREDGKFLTQAFGNSPYLRKGKVGDWKNTFTVAQSELFDKVYALRMEGSGLDFDFEL